MKTQEPTMYLHKCILSVYGFIKWSCLIYQLSYDCFVLMTVIKRRASHHPKHTFSISKWDNLGGFISQDYGAFVLSFPLSCLALSTGWLFFLPPKPPTPTPVEGPGFVQGSLGSTGEQNLPSYWAPAADPPKQPYTERELGWGWRCERWAWQASITLLSSELLVSWTAVSAHPGNSHFPGSSIFRLRAACCWHLCLGAPELPGGSAAFEKSLMSLVLSGAEPFSWAAGVSRLKKKKKKGVSRLSSLGCPFWGRGWRQ